MRPDEIVDTLAATQHGVVARHQLLTAGISRQAIDRRVAARRLLVVHPAVYLVRGHVRSHLARLSAACLAAGPAAVTSHRAAGHVHGLAIGPGPVEITVPTSMRNRLPGVLVHRSGDVPAADLTHVGSLPITRVGRTLIDLAAILDRTNLERVLDDALFRRLVTADYLSRRLSALGRQGRKGSGVLAQLLDVRLDADKRPQTVFERRLFAVLQRAGLPLPTPQFEVVLADGRRIFLDYAYGDVLLALEADSYRHHSARSDWARDHVRNRLLTSMGWRILPATWEDLAQPGPFLNAVSRGLDILPRVAG